MLDRKKMCLTYRQQIHCVSMIYETNKHGTRYADMTKAKCIVDYKYFTPSLRKVAKKYNVSTTSVHRWVSSDEKCKEIIRKRKEYKKREHTRKKEMIKCVTDIIETRPFITMQELAQVVCRQCGVKLSTRTMNRYSLEAGFTYKKAVKCVDHKHDNNQVLSYCNNFSNAYNSGCLYSLDEAAFYVGENPRKGRAKKGQRLAIGSGNNLKRTKFTLLMMISPEGVNAFQLLEHNAKKPDFERFFSKLNIQPGSTIIMDNLRAHHSKEVERICNMKGFVPLFTPPYSPRCNPIEKVFGELKPSYRHKCLNINTTSKYAFKSLIYDMLLERTTTSFSATFENTYRFLKDTIVNIENDPNFKFIGYDVNGFVKLFASG